jgi:hypothetical protein
VPTEVSQKMNEALKALGGNVKYTEYENVGHNSWDKAYADPELMKWLLPPKTGGIKCREIKIIWENKKDRMRLPAVILSNKEGVRRIDLTRITK